MTSYSYYLNYADGNLVWAVAPSVRHRHLKDKNAGTPDKDGYIRIVFKGKKMMAHRMIWEMFNGEIPEGMEVHHINGVRDDNRIDNLALTTRKQNAQRTTRKKIGLNPKTNTWYSTRSLKYFKTAGGALMGYNTHFIGT